MKLVQIGDPIKVKKFGQVTLIKEVRDALGVKDGDSIAFFNVPNMQGFVVLTKVSVVVTPDARLPIGD